jgi:hypothetical protein
MALESTGLERSKARFQALSALTGTGFTTREAEDIVNHPRRRRIASWLIFLGSVGIVSFLIVMILYVRAGIAAPTLTHIVIIVASVVVFILLVWFGVINKLTSGILKLFHKTPVYAAEGILHQLGGYGIVRIKAGDIAKLKERNITILAIERGEKALPLPKDTESVQAGDYLLCYGKLSDFDSVKK